jgi:hypothetical protein
MNEAVSTFPVMLLLRFAFAVMRVRSVLANSTYSTLRTYSLAANSVVGFSIDPTLSWAAGLGPRLRHTLHALTRLANELKAVEWTELVQKSGLWGAILFIGSAALSEARLVAIAAGEIAELAMLSVVFVALYVTNSSCRLSVAMQKATLENDHRRLRTFKAILREQRSQIFCWMLIVWLVAQSSHIDVVLGDFREGYELKKSKYGEPDALLWSRQQALREARERIVSTFHIVGWVSAFMHSIMKHFRKH